MYALVGEATRNHRVVAHRQRDGTGDQALCGGDLGSHQNWNKPRVSQVATYDIEVIPTDTKGEGEIVHQGVDHALMLE